MLEIVKRWNSGHWIMHLYWSMCSSEVNDSVAALRRQKSLTWPVDNYFLFAISCLINLFFLSAPHLIISTVASGNPSYACQLGMMLLRHPPCQMALAAWVAFLAGFTAWYLMWARSAHHLWGRSRGHCCILPDITSLLWLVLSKKYMKTMNQLFDNVLV